MYAMRLFFFILMAEAQTEVNQSTNDIKSFMAPKDFLNIVVLILVWCFIFVLAFAICLCLSKIWKSKSETPHLRSYEDEVSEVMTRKDKHKSYKEKMNSVYLEWFPDWPQERNRCKCHSRVGTEVHMNQEMWKPSTCFCFSETRWL